MFVPEYRFEALQFEAVKVSVVNSKSVDLVFVADEVKSSPYVQGVSKSSRRDSLQRSRSSTNGEFLPGVLVGGVSIDIINRELATAELVDFALALVIIDIAKGQDKLLVSGSTSVVDSTREIASNFGPCV